MSNNMSINSNTPVSYQKYENNIGINSKPSSIDQKNMTNTSVNSKTSTPQVEQKYTENKTLKSATKVDQYGNKITEKVDNNDLTTNDFLKIMMEQLKLQDPTKPKDMDKMLDSQMQMTTLNMNQNMIEALKSIQSAFNQSALSNATGVIGRWVENGSTTTDGVPKAYKVGSIEMQDGEVIVVAYEELYTHHGITIEEKGEGDNKKHIVAGYDKDGNLYDEKGEKTGNTIELEGPGTPKMKDGKLIIKDKDGKEIEDHKYVLSGQNTTVVANEPTKFPFPKITKVS